MDYKRFDFFFWTAIVRVWGSQNELLLELLEFALRFFFFNSPANTTSKLEEHSWVHCGLQPTCAFILDYGRNLMFTLHHVHTWLRYIDDVPLQWKGDIDTLHSFIEHLNQNEKRRQL